MGSRTLHYCRADFDQNDRRSDGPTPIESCAIHSGDDQRLMSEVRDNQMIQQFDAKDFSGIL